MERVVVVGAGLAGARTCHELRTLGYPGELVLVGTEHLPPYDRPPLSKAVLLGVVDDSPLEPTWYAGAQLRLGVTATGLHADHGAGPGVPGPGGVLVTTEGELAFDGLVLATGAVPRRLPGDGGARVLRSAGDAHRLRAALVPGARVLVVGAGWIGAEVATAAARRGCEVGVLEAGPAPLAVALGAEVGVQVRPWYDEAGVALRTGAAVSRVDGHGVTLAGGEHLPADVVVEGIGVRPQLGWLTDTPVELDPVTGGVLVDVFCQASMPGVVAVGDCAARESLRSGGRVRTEHWDDALHAPAVAAATLLGQPTTGYDPVPYVWSEQFGRFLQWAGWRVGPPSVWRGDPQRDQSWAAAWLDPAGRLTGFFAVDRPRDAMQARRMIGAGSCPDPVQLADPTVQVRAA